MLLPALRSGLCGQCLHVQVHVQVQVQVQVQVHVCLHAYNYLPLEIPVKQETLQVAVHVRVHLFPNYLAQTKSPVDLRPHWKLLTWKLLLNKNSCR
jgi:hypothetical protein